MTIEGLKSIASHEQALRDERPPSARAWIMLAVLSLIMAFAYLDRYLLFYLAEPIKKDLALSDAQLGVIGGLAFALFHTVFALPVARLADVWSRRWVISLGVALWSTLTAGISLAHSFGSLFVIRAGVALGESSAHAPAHSLVAENFPPRRRATALAIMNVGGVAGIVAASALGGYLGNEIGWRKTFLLFGCIGLALALVASALLRDRRSQAGLVVNRRSFVRVAAGVFGNATLRWLVAGACLHMFVSSAISSWMPSFIIRAFHVTTAEAGLIIGAGAAVAGVTGTFLGGWVTDRLAARDPRWYFWLPAIGFVAATPLYWGALFAPSTTIYFFLYMVGAFGSVWFLGPTYAVVQNLARPEDRATTSAIVLLCINLFGQSAGAPFVGLVSDWLGADQAGASIRWALVIALCVNGPAMVAYLMAARQWPQARTLGGLSLA
jgi:predicted MFS family arabinose efflux permease